MATFCVATMNSADGWETKSPQQALALHFTYWFTSRRNQGRVLGKVPSFYYIWAAHGTTPDTMQQRTKEEFDAYIKELFPVSEVEVVVSNRTTTGSQYDLQISAKVVSDGVQYDLAKAVTVTGEGFRVLDDERLG